MKTDDIRNCTAIAGNAKYAYCGTGDGKLYYTALGRSEPDWKLIYSHPQRKAIGQICPERHSTSHLLAFTVNSYDEDGYAADPEAWHIKESDGKVAVELIDYGIDHLLTHQLSVKGDWLYAFNNADSKGNIYCMEYFTYSENLSAHKTFLALNKDMHDSTIYTVSFPAEDPYAFSYDGKYLTEVARRIEAGNNPANTSENNDTGFAAFLGGIPNLEAEEERETEELNSLLPPSLVLNIHHRETYVDLVHLFEYNGILLVASGGRDCIVCISDFKTHETYFKSEYLDAIPRCGLVCKDSFYFAGTEGLIGRIDLTNLGGWWLNHKNPCRTSLKDKEIADKLGKNGFDDPLKIVRTSPDIRYDKIVSGYGNVAVLGSDNTISILNPISLSKKREVQIEGEVSDFLFLSDCMLLVLCADNEMFEIPIE